MKYASLTVLLLVILSNTTMSAQPREKIPFDQGWKFALGNAADKTKDFNYCVGQPLAKAGAGDPDAYGAILGDFDDSTWRTVDLPHDWAVELPFMTDARYFPQKPWHVYDHGYKPVGPNFPETSIGWYRKSFEIPKSDEGRRISIVFDGSFRDTEVWLNNYRIGRYEGGYAGFRFDVTDYLNYGGKNVLAVRVDATKYEGWFYEGAGIYRHVWLEKTGLLRVAPFGLRVVADAEKVSAWIKLVNDGATPPPLLVARVSILDADGKQVAEKTGPVTLGEGALLPEIAWATPELWSLESPYLYRYVVELNADGVAADRVESTFGVRTIKFDPDRGFLLNGKRVAVRGACAHQDHAGVGVAVPDALLEWRLQQLKKWGFNAYRTSHHAPAPELLDLCDRLGMLVLDENRLIGSSEYVLRDLRYLVERDRNHPCVIAWSLGNEEAHQSTPQAARIGGSMKRLVRQLDDTRPVTYACNCGADNRGIMSQLDLFGINYTRPDEFDAFHKSNPHWSIWCTEEASALATRGIYAKDDARCHVSAYDLNQPGWGHTAEEVLKILDARPWLAGAFIWTGFDYRGEPTPFYNGWPDIGSHFGVLDTCGFPKDTAWYYRAWWTDQPVLHILPHWNWQGREGQEIDVWCHTNHEEVELFLNGESLGRKPAPRLSHVSWKVKYAPGTLSAKAYRHGEMVQEAEVVTTGAPATLTADPSKTLLKAGGQDCVVINVAVCDALGRVVATADNQVSFEVSDNAHILGVGNGDPSCHEPDVILPPPGKKAKWNRSAFNGYCQVIVAAPKERGEFAVRVSGADLKPLELKLRAE